MQLLPQALMNQNKTWHLTFWWYAVFMRAARQASVVRVQASDVTCPITPWGGTLALLFLSPCRIYTGIREFMQTVTFPFPKNIQSLHKKMVFVYLIQSYIYFWSQNSMWRLLLRYFSHIHCKHLLKFNHLTM